MLVAAIPGGAPPGCGGKHMSTQTSRPIATAALSRTFDTTSNPASSGTAERLHPLTIALLGALVIVTILVVQAVDGWMGSAAARTATPLSLPELQAMLLVIVMFLAGLLLKVIDDICDEGILPTKVGIGLAVIDGLLFALVMLTRDGFIFLGAIFWSALARGKVDANAFRVGYGWTAVLWVSLVVLLQPFPIAEPLLWALLGWNVLSAVITSKAHDALADRLSGAPAWVLLEHRNLHFLLLAPLPILGLVGWASFFGIVLFNAGYSLGKPTASLIEERWGTPAPRGALT